MLESRVRIGCGDQCREIAFLRDKRPGPLAPRRRPRPGLINKVSQLLRKRAMPDPRLMRRDLHRHGQKLLVVAVDMATQQGYEVLRRGHLPYLTGTDCLVRQPKLLLHRHGRAGTHSEQHRLSANRSMVGIAHFPDTLIPRLM
jgi:hypothetical protein